MKMLNKIEFEKQTKRRLNERPIEYAFVFKKMAEIYPHAILDVGTGMTALPRVMRGCGPVVTAVDNIRDYWPNGMFNPYYYVVDDDIKNTKLNMMFDFITCVSTLEHIKEFNAAVHNMVSLLKPEGCLILTFPYCETQYIPNVYELPGSTHGHGLPFVTQAFSRRELEKWVRDYGIKILDQEYWNCWSGDYWTVGTQIIPPKKVKSGDPHQLSCILLQKQRI